MVATQSHTVLSLSKRPRRRRGITPRGFLLVELVIGLVIVALVMLGAAAIMGAVAQGWNDQDVTRSTQMQANQTYLRVQNALEGAEYVGYVTPSTSQSGSVLLRQNGILVGVDPGNPCSIFFWQNDNLGGVEAGDPYVGEMALLQYDPATTTLWLYQVPSSQLSNSQAQQPLTLAEISESTEATWFTQLSIVEKQALGGPGNQPNDGTRLEVSSFQVDVNSLTSTSQLPVIEYSIGFTRNNGTANPIDYLTLYNTTTIRGPATQPE
jgi:type II secretory pathway component PulJ